MLKRYTSSGGYAIAMLLAMCQCWSIASAEELVEFQIPAQPAAKGLNLYAEQADLQIMFPYAAVREVETNEVVGSFEKDVALETLLANTGLEIVYGTNNTATVRQIDVESSGQKEAGDPGKMPPAPILMAQNRTPAEQSRERQTNRAFDDQDELAVPRLEEIVVTGSRIRGAQSASPIVTIDRAEIDMAGFATVEEVVEYLPQNFGTGASSDIDSSANLGDIVGGSVGSLAGGASVNLRGLGASSTLVLLNGWRMSPSGFSSAFTNIGSIPVTAIERIEVLTDGASAIYGADAIGGVINFILREDYEGAETRLRYGSDAGGDTSDVQFGQTFGTSWGSGSILLSYEYFDREALASTDRAFTASSDLRPFGGTDWRQLGGSPANIIADGQTFAIPDGQDGTALTPADFVGLENTQNLFNERAAIDLMPDLDRHSAFLHLRQRIGVVELFAAARASLEENVRRKNNLTINDFTVNDESPWFVDPTNSGLTQVRVDNYSISEEAGPIASMGELDTFGATLGAQTKFAENWSGDLSFNWSKEQSLRATSGLDRAGRDALIASVNLSNPVLAFNPFSDGSNVNNRAILEPLIGPFKPELTYDNELWSADIGLDGSLFELAGGAVKLAAGISFRHESLFTVNGLLFPPTTEEDLSRDIRAVYAELFVPLVGHANSRPGLQRLEVSLAARHDDYSDFGSSANPKLGVLWSPLQSLTLRGTIGTSYRAPALSNLSAARELVFFFPPATIAAMGNNTDLQAEEATTWTAGIQWAPEAIDGLSLDVTYFEVEFTDRIETPAPSVIVALSDPAAFESIVTRNPTPEQITAFANRSSFLDAFGVTAEDVLSGAVPIDLIVDNRLTNLAESEVTGVELQLSYAADSGLGTFSAGLNGNYLFDFKRKLLPTDPLVDEVDTYGRPVDFRARGNVGWSRNNWSVAGFVNYTDGYTDSVSGPARPDDPRRVDSWTTMDLTIAYETGSDSGFLSGIRVSLTTQNLFDEDPPFVDTRAGVGYDAINANPLGRFFVFQLTRDW